MISFMIIASGILFVGIIALIFAPLLEKLDRHEDADEFILQGKMIDPATSEARYFDIELTARREPRSATG